MDKFSTLLPFVLTREQQVIHEEMYGLLQSMITELVTFESLMKRISNKMSVLALPTSGTGSEVADLRVVSTSLTNATTLLKNWVAAYETNNVGSVV